MEIPDIQNRLDSRNIPINRVGVKDIRYPIEVLDRANGKQLTIANVAMYVNLHEPFKGTHMSRFVEILNHYHAAIAADSIPAILEEMKLKLDADHAYIEFSFPYFIQKLAPVSKTPGLMEYICFFTGQVEKAHDFILGVQVPVLSVCPCSKEISKYGAHNQRSIVKLQVRYTDFVWLEDLILLIEKCGSAPIYPVLKREDEKYITEVGYENPVFVEDIVRNLAEYLNNMPNIRWASIECESIESIHNHNAYAFIQIDKRESENDRQTENPA